MLIAATTKGNPLSTLLVFAVLGGVFYIMLIRPQQRRAKAQRALVNSIETGDEVMTGGGIFGVIIDIDEDDDIVTLEIADGVRIRILRAGISRRIENYDDDDDDTQGDSGGSSPSIDQPDQSKEL